MAVLALAAYGAVSLWLDTPGPAMVSAVFDWLGPLSPLVIGAIIVLAVVGQLLGLAAWLAARKPSHDTETENVPMFGETDSEEAQ
jgi:hypothetical protein